MEAHDSVSLRDYMDTRFDAMDKAVELQFNASQTAISRANQAIDYRLANLNEFRASLQDQTRNYATRNELEALRDAHESELKSLSRQVYILVGALTAVQFLLQWLLP